VAAADSAADSAAEDSAADAVAAAQVAATVVSVERVAAAAIYMKWAKCRYLRRSLRYTKSSCIKARKSHTVL
jgi:hypothetical protein